MYTILAADIGATNSRFALFRCDTDTAGLPALSFLREQWFTGEEYPAFRDVLKALRKNHADRDNPGKEIPAMLPAGEVPYLAVVAPAGPVEGDICRTSNIPWVIRGSEIREELGIPTVHLINDFAAQGYACLMPDQIDVAGILSGTAVCSAPIAVVGAGTGFGKALLLTREKEGCAAITNGPVATGTNTDTRTEAQNTGGYGVLPRLREALVLPTEGGHAEFPFMGSAEYEFAEFVRSYTGLHSIIGDMIVTGTGLAHIHAFLTGERLPPREVPARISQNPKVLEWFARFYGRLCRNYVLDTLALGGLYITGGMALRVPALTHPAFAAEFHDSVAQKRLLQKVPVWHIRSPQAGLWGAALYGVLQEQKIVSGL